jgi:hypothetical protein
MRPIQRAQERGFDPDPIMPPPPLPVSNRLDIPRPVSTPSVGVQGNEQIHRSSNFASNPSRQSQPHKRLLRVETSQNTPSLSRQLVHTPAPGPSMPPMTPLSVSMRHFNLPSQPISHMRPFNPQANSRLRAEPSLPALPPISSRRARMPFQPEARC